jgi:hypothetical protein
VLPTLDKVFPTNHLKSSAVGDKFRPHPNVFAKRIIVLIFEKIFSSKFGKKSIMLCTTILYSFLQRTRLSIDKQYIVGKSDNNSPADFPGRPQFL